MEKRKMQRIIGVTVVLAVVAVLFPLLFGRSEAPVTTAMRESPALPDQASPTPAMQLADDNTADAAPMTEAANTTAAPAEEVAAPANDNGPAPVGNVVQAAADNHVDIAPVAINNNPAPEIVASNTEIAPATPANPTVQQPIAVADAAKPVAATLDTAPSTKRSHAKTKVAKAAASQKSLQKTLKQVAHHDANDKSGWAVQMGSFRNKQNALALAKKLRAAGYEAFTREVSMKNNTIQTRVYIGPVVKHASAQKTSSKLEQQMKMQGLIVKYEPIVA